MLAAVVEEIGAPFELVDIELDAPRADEVLVELRGVGICHTDLSAANGVMPMPFPAVLGHEGAGVVVQAGADTDLEPGDHVVLSFASCGACRQCGRGHPAYCAAFAQLNHSGARPDGSVTMRRGGEPVYGSFLGQSSFATHALAAGRSAVRVPRDVPLEPLAPLGCSVQTGAGAVLNVLDPEPGSTLVVFGAGPVGLSAAMAAVAVGVEVTVVEPLAARRELAGRFGARALPEVEGRFDYAVETVGTEPVLQAAIRALHSPGACATLGYHGGRNPMTLDQGRLLFGRTLTGVIEGDAEPRAFIPRLVELDLPLGQLITPFPFTAIGDAIAATRAGDVVKAVLTF